MLDQPAPRRNGKAGPRGPATKLYLRKGAMWCDAVVRSLLLQTAKGNTTAIRELLERLDGKVMTPVSGTGGGPIQGRIRVVYGNDRNDA